MSNSVPILSKITTLYVPAEDRVRISGLLNDNSVAVIWITQRFLNRLIPNMTKWLEKQTADMPRADLMQSVQQDRAKARQKQRIEAGEDQPVAPENADLEWLALTVDIQQRSDQFRLIFKDIKGDEGYCAMLPLQPMLLRAWLNVLMAAFKQAGWHLDSWPEWMQEEAPPQSAPVPKKALH